MLAKCEMSTDRFFRIFNFYVPKMVDKPVLDTSGGLSHVLHTTFGAGDSINKVGATTRDIFHCGMFRFSDIGCNVSRFVKSGAISAMDIVTEIETPGMCCTGFGGVSFRGGTGHFIEVV